MERMQNEAHRVFSRDFGRKVLQRGGARFLAGPRGAGPFRLPGAVDRRHEDKKPETSAVSGFFMCSPDSLAQR